MRDGGMGGKDDDEVMGFVVREEGVGRVKDVKSGMRDVGDGLICERVEWVEGRNKGMIVFLVEVEVDRVGDLVNMVFDVYMVGLDGVNVRK